MSRVQHTKATATRRAYDLVRRIGVDIPEHTLAGTPLNLACRLATFDDPDWLATFRSLGFNLDDNVHRKAWEWTQCVHGLDRIGALAPDAKVLGVAAGHEPVLYLLANRVDLVVGTDLYGGVFATSVAQEATPDFLQDPVSYAPFPYRPEHLLALPADGLTLPFATAAFDVTYSLSSIEHFGGHPAAKQAMLEMARVTRPGGIVCVATEWIIDGGTHEEFFTTDELAEFVFDVPGLTLLEEVDLTLPEPEVLDDPVRPPQDDAKLPHIVLEIGGIRFTSVIAFFRRTGPKEYLRGAAGRVVPAIRNG